MHGLQVQQFTALDAAGLQALRRLTSLEFLSTAFFDLVSARGPAACLAALSSIAHFDFDLLRKRD
jgi:hypothetical protein